MAFLEIFGLAHVYDDDIRFFRNQMGYFDGAGRESHFVGEELPGLGRVALECFSHNRRLFLHGRDVLQIRAPTYQLFELRNPPARKTIRQISRTKPSPLPPMTGPPK
jgi:hypothetical protein